MIRIVVDSTCDLPEFILTQYNIITLPMVVNIDGVAYLDKLEINRSKVYAAIENGSSIKTAQVDLDSATRVFTELCENKEDFIYIAFSSNMSCTYSSACEVLRDFRSRYPDVSMEIIDSKGGCLATGLIVLQAARLAEKGCGFDDIVSKMVEMVNTIEHIFTIADIRWLVKGGRLDPLKGAIGAILNVKPILTVTNGMMDVVKKARGTKNVIAAVIDLVSEKSKEFPEQIIGIAHANNSQGADDLKKRLAERLRSSTFVMCEVGSVLGAHLGIGALGVFFFNKKPTFYLS